MRKNNLDVAKPAITRLRCAIYTRKSTEEGLDQEFNSLNAQREAGEPSFKASGARVGSPFPRSTTTADSPGPTWTGQR
jgi:site-specific DNA recombinase